MKKKIALLTKELSKYQKEIEEEHDQWQRWILNQKDSSHKYVAFAYKLHNHPNTITKKLSRQINKFININQSAFSSVEDAFFTLIEPHYYFVVTRKYRISRTFADVITDSQKKKTLNIYNITKIIVKSMEQLQSRMMVHNNLSLDKIQYFQTNVIIELPLFGMIKAEQQILNQQKEQINRNRQNNISNQQKQIDICSFLQIVQRLSVGDDVNLINFGSSQNERIQLINKIQQPTIKRLFQHIFLQKNKQNKSPQKLTFKQISYFLQKDHWLSYEEIVKQRQFIDILGLALMRNTHSSICSYSRQVLQEKQSQVKLSTNFQNYHLQIRTNRNCLYFNIESNINKDLFFSVVLNGGSKHFPFSKYFKSIENFITFITKKNNYTFQITESGVLAVMVPIKQLIEIESKLFLQTYQKQVNLNYYPYNIMGYLHLNKNYLARGFLLNSTTVLTTAYPIYNKSSEQYTTEKCTFISSINQQSQIKSWQTPYNYIKCDLSDSWKQNLSSITLKKPLNKPEYPTLLYDYNQSEMIRRIEESKLPQFLLYYINGVYYSPKDVIVTSTSITNISRSIEKGTPIFLSIGKRMAIIGMKTDKSKGLLFNKQHAWFMYSSLTNEGTRNQIINTHIYPAALFNFKVERSDYISPEFPLNEVVSNQQHITNTWIILQKEVEKKVIYSKDKLTHYNILLKLYQTYFSQNHWKISIILLNIALVHKQQANYPDAEKTIRKGICHEQIYGRWNPFILTQFYFYLAEILQKQQKYVEAEIEYQKAISLSEKVRLFTILGKCYHNMGLNKMAQGLKYQSYKWFVLSAKYKQKSRDKQDLVISLRECVLVSIFLGKLTEAGENMEKMVRVVLKQSQKLKKMVDLIWSVFTTKIDDSDQKESQALKIRNRIRKRYYKQQLQD